MGEDKNQVWSTAIQFVLFVFQFKFRAGLGSAERNVNAVLGSWSLRFGHVRSTHARIFGAGAMSANIIHDRLLRINEHFACAPFCGCDQNWVSRQSRMYAHYSWAKSSGNIHKCHKEENQTKGHIKMQNIRANNAERDKNCVWAKSERAREREKARARAPVPCNVIIMDSTTITIKTIEQENWNARRRLSSQTMLSRKTSKTVGWRKRNAGDANEQFTNQFENGRAHGTK